jgi:hypothetical protein
LPTVQIKKRKKIEDEENGGWTSFERDYTSFERDYTICLRDVLRGVARHK